MYGTISEVHKCNNCTCVLDCPDKIKHISLEVQLIRDDCNDSCLIVERLHWSVSYSIQELRLDSHFVFVLTGMEASNTGVSGWLVCL